MFGNKTLYTTVKCRSMTTQHEFIDQWNRSHNEYRLVILQNRMGWIESNRFMFYRSEDNRVFVELYRDHVDSGELVSMINIEMIEEVI